jgi:hypothetical protein
MSAGAAGRMSMAGWSQKKLRLESGLGGKAIGWPQNRKGVDGRIKSGHDEEGKGAEYTFRLWRMAVDV